MNLGKTQWALGDRGPALESIRSALKIREALVTSQPADVGRRSAVAENCSLLAAMQAMYGNPAGAVAAFQESISIWRKLAEEHPQQAEYQNALAGTMCDLAGIYRSQQKLAEAKQLLIEAEPYHRAALDADPNQPRFRQFYRINRGKLSGILTALGDHEGAFRTAQELAEIAAGVDDVYNAAGFLGKCVKLAEQDPDLAEDQRTERVKQYADKAMALLSQAVEQGFADEEQIEQNADLDPLRGRDDFQALVAGLKDKNKKEP